MTATTTPPAGWSTNRGLVFLAVGYQWFYNGANFLAFKLAGNALHPLMVATLRFSIAAVILVPFAMVRWRRLPASLHELASAALIGVVMLVASQALAIWSAHFLPAGVAAVFGSSAPLFLALMGWSSAAGNDFKPIGVGLALIASASWAAGSLLAPRLVLPRDPVIGLTSQLVAAGMVLGAIIAVSGIAAATDFARVPLQAWGALAFLIVASTLIGYAIFLALNAKVSPTLANTFNYAAPVIALCLSALLLHEPLTIAKLVAGGITLAGVALMIDRKAFETQKPHRVLKDAWWTACSPRLQRRQKPQGRGHPRTSCAPPAERRPQPVERRLAQFLRTKRKEIKKSSAAAASWPRLGGGRWIPRPGRPEWRHRYLRLGRERCCRVTVQVHGSNGQ